jgi:signal transduction histidine kinase
VPLFVTLSVADSGGMTIFGEELPTGTDLGANSFGGFVGNVEFDATRPYVPLVTQARSRTGERIGALVARLDLSFVRDALATARLPEGTELVVVDGNGHIIARSGNNGEAPSDTVIQRALGSVDEGSMRENGRITVYRNLVAFQSRRGVPWAVLLTQSEDDALALAHATTRDSIVIAVLVLTLALLLGALLANRLTRPLRQLALRADAIAEGGEPGETILTGPGEIGQLAQRLQEMAGRIGEREKLRAALAHEDRLATVGTITAGVAHEINNPLTTILGYSQLLLEDKEADHADVSSLKLISDEAARMKTIVGNLLDYSRSEAPASGVAHVPEVLKRVATLLGPTLRRQQSKVALSLDNDLPAVGASAQALQQIFINLVQNASQAMPEGGTVEVHAKRSGESVEVSILDSGPGVPKAAREQIFEAFYTTKTMGTGTGLGLAVTRHLVDGFRGKISVGDREKSRGAQFKVVIPIANGPAQDTDH